MSYRSPVDVLLILIRDGAVLLALRAGTGYADGWWNLPSGKLEDGEDIRAAVLREAHEEIGVDIQPDDLAHVATVHYRNPEGEGRIGVFFQAQRWAPEPCNQEPHKCASIGWYPLDALPPATFPFTVAGLELHAKGEHFGISGWPSNPDPQPGDRHS